MGTSVYIINQYVELPIFPWKNSLGDKATNKLTFVHHQKIFNAFKRNFGRYIDGGKCGRDSSAPGGILAIEIDFGPSKIYFFQKERRRLYR